MAELKEDDLAPGEVRESDLGAGGGGGHEDRPAQGGHTGGPGGQEKLPSIPIPTKLGTPADTARSFANTMTFGAAPQLEGVMGATAQDVVSQLGKHRPATPDELLAAYEDVRNAGAREHGEADKTVMGSLGNIAGVLAPHPALPTAAPGASTLRRFGTGAGVGGGVGFVSGVAQSPADLTSGKAEEYGKAFLSGAKAAVPGALFGGTGGALMSKAVSPTRALAEEQALRASGLGSGIKNQIQKDLGVTTMAEARELGRKALDEGLIPWVGSAEKVGENAEKLQGQAGNTVGGILTQYETAGHKADYPRAAAAMRAPINDPSQTTAVARSQAGKALDMANIIENEASKNTPGSMVGLNKEKSDLWKGADFSNDPELAAVQYRKAVSGLRGDIENQVGEKLGPQAKADLAEANRRFGVGADIAKLAANEATRSAGRKGLGMPEVLALLAGAGAGAGTGHGVTGGATGAIAGLAAQLAAKGLNKYGHSTAARGADALAGRFAGDTGGHLGGMVGASRPVSEVEDRLAPWLKLLGKEEENR